MGERIGFFEALKQGHPFRRYSIGANGHVQYVTARNYSSYLEKQILDVCVEYEKLKSHQVQLKAQDDDQIDTEMERAIDGWYRTDIDVRFQADYIAALHEEHAKLRDDMAREKERSEALQVQLSNIADSDGKISGILKDMSPQCQRYAAEFLKTIIPPVRTNGIDNDNNRCDRHSRPRDFDHFLDRISAIPYVTRYEWHARDARTTKVLDIGEENGLYFINLAYSNGNSFNARVRVFTTANTGLQAEFVKKCLEMRVTKS